MRHFILVDSGHGRLSKLTGSLVPNLVPNLNMYVFFIDYFQLMKMGWASHIDEYFTFEGKILHQMVNCVLEENLEE